MLEHEIERGQRARAKHRDRAEVPQAHTARDQDDNADAADDHHGRGMRLKRQQYDIRRQQVAVRPHHAFQAAHALRVARDPLGKADDNRDLGQLGRLEAEQPSARTAADRADARYRNQDQQDERADHDDVAEMRIDFVVDFGNHDHRNHACGCEHALPCDKVRRAALIEQRVGIACGKQCNQADDQQQHDRKKHPGVPRMGTHARMRIAPRARTRLRPHCLLARDDRARRTRHRPRRGAARGRAYTARRPCLSACRSHGHTSIRLRGITKPARAQQSTPAGTEGRSGRKRSARSFSRPSRTFQNDGGWAPS